MKKNKTTYFNTVKQHVINNFNLYIIISIFFMIGIIAGVLFSNNINKDVQEPINIYINEFISSLNDGYEIDYGSLLKEININHIKFTIVIWLMGCTVIGIPIVYALITWKGFALSYTISSIILNIGIQNGIIFSILSLLLQNIITIPVTLALGVSGNRLYKSIVKDKRKESIKIEILKHTIFCFVMLILLVLSSLIEVYISSNLTLIYVTKYMKI